MEIELVEADPRYPRPASILTLLTSNSLDRAAQGGVFLDDGGTNSRIRSTSSFNFLDSPADGNSTIHARTSTANSINWSEMQLILFCAYGVVGPLIISVGLVGNALTLITLLGRTPIWSNSTTYTYLKWLAITDTGSIYNN
jgi:hypothetical protein